MPVRITDYWRPALKSIARLQSENPYPEFEFFWRSYTRNQRKAVRRMRRELLSKMEQRSGFEPLTPTQHAVLRKAAPAQHGAVLTSVLSSTGEQTVGELIGELSEFVRRRSKK